MRYEVIVTWLPYALTGPAPTPSPGPTLTCADDGLCEFIYERTGVEWLAEGGYYLLVKPFRITLILVLALLLRAVVTRMIRRVVASAGEGRRPGLLRPLRERMPTALKEAAGLGSERRSQRAEALGSVLRSVSSVAIFVVAAMLVLGELGVDLAPLIASAGIVGIALGFGAQNLVKDFLAGLFMLVEDQYGVGDVVDVGEASGTVESVGLRITTIRDGRGVLWYIRNGEIIRVGNKSQGWALVVVDMPVGFAMVEAATGVLGGAAAALAADPEFADDLLEPPTVLGVEQVTVDGPVVRTTAKTPSESQWRVGRELRRRLTEAMEAAGLAAQMSAGRMYVRPPQPTAVDTGPARAPNDHEVGGAT
jgi:moderate conductance mechanosensitive channel